MDLKTKNKKMEEAFKELLDITGDEFIRGMYALLHHLQDKILGTGDVVSKEAIEFINKTKKEIKNDN